MPPHSKAASPLTARGADIGMMDLVKNVVTQRKGQLRVAVPVKEGKPLLNRTVRRTMLLIRNERGSR